MRSSLGVGLDLVQVIFMALDREIESPVQVDSRLPEADGFIEFLGTKRRVVDSLQAKTQLKQMDADLKEEALLVHQAIDWTDVLREAEKLGANHNRSEEH